MVGFGEIANGQLYFKREHIEDKEITKFMIGLNETVKPSIKALPFVNSLPLQDRLINNVRFMQYCKNTFFLLSCDWTAKELAQGGIVIEHFRWLAPPEFKACKLARTRKGQTNLAIKALGTNSFGRCATN